MFVSRNGFASFAISALLGYMAYSTVRAFRRYILANTFGSGTSGLG